MSLVVEGQRRLVLSFQERHHLSGDKKKEYQRDPSALVVSFVIKSTSTYKQQQTYIVLD